MNDQTVKNKKQKLEIIKIGRDIKRKYLKLRKGEQDEELKIQKSLKPISDPLKELIMLQQHQPLLSTSQPPATKIKNKKQPSSTPLRTGKIQPTKLESKFLSDDEVFEAANQSLEKEDDDDDQQQEALNYSAIQSQLAGHVDSPEFQTFLNSFHSLPQEYIIKYLDGKNIDPHGIKYDGTQWIVGNTPVDIDGKDFIISGVRYEGTPGLYELLFKSNPIGVKEKDVENYQHIIKKTHMYRASHEPGGRIYGNKSAKYKMFIQPALSASISAASIASRIKPRTLRSRSKTYSGGHLLQANDYPINYRYFDDPNELVDRLLLLKAAESAGNNSVNNEIVSIEEELRELNLIY